MLTLSKKTDYALLALSYLMRSEGERTANTREIAEQFDIPVELLAKILQRLARANMVVSTPGPTGGYRLARPAHSISVASVIETVDGRPAIAQCLRVDHNGCDQHTKCTIKKPLERINTKIFQLLDVISIAEINRDDDTISLGLTVRQPAPRKDLASSLS